MDQQSDLRCIEMKLEKMEAMLDAVVTEISQQQSNSIGDWVDEKTIKRITGLGKTTLYQLRKENKISYSTIAGKSVFYRISDFENILRQNELNRK